MNPTQVLAAYLSNTYKCQLVPLHHSDLYYPLGVGIRMLGIIGNKDE